MNCENTDCPGNYKTGTVKKVEPKEKYKEAEDEKWKWCHDCIARDGDMLK